MNKYEIMFIVKAELDEKAVKETASNLEKVLKDMKADILDSKDLGQKKLAYPIKNSVRGYYYLLNILSLPKAIQEFDRKAKIDNNVLRHMIIKLEE
jgi:small subunit ribosomal protein S6